MTWDDAIQAFAHSDTLPAEAMQWVLDEWEATGSLCRAILHDYVTGADLSERTEQALYVILHLLGEKAETATFPDLCALALDDDRAGSVLNEFGMFATLPALFINTFDGDASRLFQIVETHVADPTLRADTLLVLAHLGRARRIQEATLYEYLAGLPDRLPEDTSHEVWFGYAQAVAALGYAGLAGRVEQLFQRGVIATTLLTPAVFWEDLRRAQADPHNINLATWDTVRPMGSAIEWLENLGDELDEFDEFDEFDDVGLLPPAPVRNPLRAFGRNDPCPCGSGKKYKKCCLAA